MRRIAVKYAKPGMLLGAPVYDNYGTMLLDADIRLDEQCIGVLLNNSVVELLLDDWRVTDVPVEPLVPPELEGKAAHAFRRLIVENQGQSRVAAKNINDVVRTVDALVRRMELESAGKAATAGINAGQDYMYLQSVKTAVLSVLLGKSAGLDMSDLSPLGVAATLKDVGYISVPQEILQRPDLLTEKELLKIRQHPMFGYELLSQHRSTSGAIANAVLQHHERWNGTGYPYGSKQTDINRFAQVIAICDTYTALLSKRPGRRMFMPHEATEYIMAYAGEQFNPELVELFVGQVPCYSTGLTVRLNTKEIGIISDTNPGAIGKPVVRVIYDEDSGKVSKPYDIDLSQVDYQHKLITEVMDYY